MKFEMRAVQSGPFDDLVGKTLPITINGYAAGECVITSIGGDGGFTFEIDGDSPAARAIARGDLRQGDCSLGTVARRAYDGQVHATEEPRLDFPLRVQPRDES